MLQTFSTGTLFAEEETKHDGCSLVPMTFVKFFALLICDVICICQISYLYLLKSQILQNEKHIWDNKPRGN